MKGTTNGRASDTGGGGGVSDIVLVEIDLATAAQLRTLPVVQGVQDGEILNGERGPIIVAWADSDVTVVWLDRVLSELARRTFVLHDGEGMVPYAPVAVGDRVATTVLSDIDDTFVRPSVRVHVFDADGKELVRVCPAAAFGTQITPWGDDVLVTVSGGGAGPLACAFRADGKGSLRVHRYPVSSELQPDSEWPSIELLGDAGTFDTPDRREIGKDLRPGGPLLNHSIEGPEQIAAERDTDLPGSVSATLVNGTMVLRLRSPHDGYFGPYFWLYNPHAEN